MIDEVDRTLLTLLQTDARMANAELARQVGMAPSAVLERVRRLEDRGLICGYEARLNSKQLGHGLVAFIFVRAEERVGAQDTGLALASIPEVQEVHSVAGEDCFLVKLRTADTQALAALLREKFGAIPNIHSTRTTIVLETVKESATIPLEAAPAREGKERSRG